MPEFKTLSDYYKPPTAHDMLSLAYLGREMEYAKLRNRLQEMKVEGENNRMRGWSDEMSGVGGGGSTPGAPGMPGMPPGLSGGGADAFERYGSPPGQGAGSGIQGRAHTGTVASSPPTNWGTGTEKYAVGYQPQDADYEADLLVESMIGEESGGDPNAVGKKGETGALQFMPDTWMRYSSEYNEKALGRKGPMADTYMNQVQVGTWKVKNWLMQGYSPPQIVSMWNAGEKNPDWVGRKGQDYDTEGHVGKVMGRFTSAMGLGAGPPNMQALQRGAAGPQVAGLAPGEPLAYEAKAPGSEEPVGGWDSVGGEGATGVPGGGREMPADPSQMVADASGGTVPTQRPMSLFGGAGGAGGGTQPAAGAAPAGAGTGQPGMPRTPTLPASPSAGMGKPLDPNAPPSYNAGRMEAMLEHFNAGVKKVLEGGSKEELNKYLDYVERFAPALKGVTRFYRGIEPSKQGALEGTIPKDVVSKELVAEWLPKTPAIYHDTLRNAIGKYGLKFKYDMGKKMVTHLEPAKDTSGTSMVPKNAYDLAYRMVAAKKRTDDDPNPYVDPNEVREQMVQNRIEEKKREADASVRMDETAMKARAEYFLKTGMHQPGMGWGQAAQLRRDMIENMAMKIAREKGLDIDLAAQSMEWKANQQNFPKVQNIYYMTKQFEETVKMNIPLIKQTFDNYKLFPVKKVAELENYIKEDVIGDPDARVLYNMIYETMVDYGKVVSGNFSIAGLTDAARSETQKLLNAADTPAAREAILDSLEKLMENRAAAIRATAEDILEQYRGVGGPEGKKQRESEGGRLKGGVEDAGGGGSGEGKGASAVTERKLRGAPDGDTILMYIKKAKGNLNEAKRLAREEGYEVD